MPGEVSPRADRETQESEFYFTDHSLTGQSTSFLCADLLALPMPNFFHHLHFDWQTGCLSVPRVESWQVTHRLRVGLSGNVSVRTVHLIFI